MSFFPFITANFSLGMNATMGLITELRFHNATLEGMRRFFIGCSGARSIEIV